MNLSFFAGFLLFVRLIVAVDLEIPLESLEDAKNSQKYFINNQLDELSDLVDRLDVRDVSKAVSGNYANVANDSGYIYTEAQQSSHPNAIYEEITEAQEIRLGKFFGFVPKFEVIDEWDIRDVHLAPGQYKGYNFTVWSNESQTITQYAILAFLSACICTIPDILNNVTDFSNYLSIYSSYGDESFGFDSFEDGYFQDQNYAIEAPLSTLFYIAAKPIEYFTPNTSSSDDIFTLQVGFSVSDVPFQWDNSTFASLVDADDDSALFQTGKFNTTASNGTNQTDSVINRAESIKLQIFRNDGSCSFQGLTKSFCAVQRAVDDIVDGSKIHLSFVDKDENYRKRFFVDGLNASTDYVAYVTADVGGLDEPGVVYNKIEFTTDSADTCELAHDLDFCSDVSYSIPQSSQFNSDHNSTVLFQLYDDYARSLYENFSKSMDQVNCAGSLDAVFSPIRSCDHCKDSYKRWLCGMVFPRCTSQEEPGYLLREVNSSRNDFLNNIIQPPNPYYEILPCIDLCYAIVRDCPPDFSFACPSHNVSLKKSYQFYEDEEYTTCNLVGLDASDIVNSGNSLVINKNYYILLMFSFLVWYF